MLLPNTKINWSLLNKPWHCTKWGEKKWMGAKNGKAVQECPALRKSQDTNQNCRILSLQASLTESHDWNTNLKETVYSVWKLIHFPNSSKQTDWLFVLQRSCALTSFRQELDGLQHTLSVDSRFVVLHLSVNDVDHTCSSTPNSSSCSVKSVHISFLQSNYTFVDVLKNVVFWRGKKSEFNNVWLKTFISWRTFPLKSVQLLL